MLLKLAWRNLWRNKLRSLILIFSIVFGLTAALFIIGLMNGILQDRNKKIIETQYAHLLVSTSDFAKIPKPNYIIRNIQNFEKFLDTLFFVQNYAERIQTFGIISSPYNSFGISINGIDAKKDKQVFKLQNYLIDSQSVYLDKATKENAILISLKTAEHLQLVSYEIDLDKISEIRFSKDLKEKLKQIENQRFKFENEFYDTLEKILSETEFEKYADYLALKFAKIKLGKKVFLQFQDTNGNIVNEVFYVCGIFDTKNTMFDEFNVFVKKDYLAKLLNLKTSDANQIFILTKDIKKIENYKKIIQNHYPNLDVKTIFDLDLYLKLSASMMNVIFVIFEVFVLFALSFGLVNTLLMAVLERKKEFGMLLAIGMKKSKILTMITLESIFTTLIGGILGLILGFLLTAYLNKIGIDLSIFIGEGMEAIGFTTVFRPKLEIITVVYTTVLVIITGILGSVYPAFKAIKINPTEALKTDF